MPIGIVVADDSTVVRAALGAFLHAEPDMAVLAAVENGQQAVDAAMRVRPDVVVMDLMMPVLGGVAATRAILRHSPLIRVLMVTGVGKRSSVREAFAAGVSGYLLKGGDPNAVIDGVRTCHAGGRVVSDHLRPAIGW